MAKIREEAKRARNDLYRQHIIAAAEKVFADRGFEAAKVQEIADICELSVGTIYAQFPSKGDLFSAILEERGEELLRLVEQVTGRPSSALEQLRALIAAYIDYFVAHPDFLRMHLRLGSSWVLTPNTEVQTRVAHWTRIHALQADIFHRGIEDGTFIEEDPVYLARVFSAMDQVLLAEWVESGMKATRDQLVSRLQSFTERALCRR